MIIISQKEASLFILNNLKHISLERDKGSVQFYYYEHSDGTKVNFGEYKNMQDAKIVLKRICEEYQYCEQCKCGFIGEQTPNFIFQMPTANEV